MLQGAARHARLCKQLDTAARLIYCAVCGGKDGGQAWPVGVELEGRGPDYVTHTIVLTSLHTMMPHYVKVRRSVEEPH